MACYDIALTNLKYQFERADDFYITRLSLTPEELDGRMEIRSNLFRPSVRLLSEPPGWESENLETKAAWYERFGSFVKDWQVPGENIPVIGDTISTASEEEFSRSINALLIVYLSGVAATLNIVPTIMWTFPIAIHKDFLAV
jgi:hypothetical protein